MEDEPRSLKSVFAAAEERRDALEGTYEASSPGYREALSPAIKDYEECLRLISSLALFSPNETADDISTSDIPYLLVDFHLAELLQKTPFSSPAERLKTLAAAREVYERFLRLLDGYDLLEPANARLFERYMDAPREFSTLARDPYARRDSKIANARAESDLRARLAALRKHPHYAAGDDEALRAAHLAHVALAAHQALQALEGLNREEEVLAQASVPLLPQVTTVEEDEEARRLSGDTFSERLDRPLRRLQSALGNGGGPLLSKDGKPLQPFTIVGGREELAKGVFRPGHNLPTMSIDEYLEEERRRGGIIEGGGEASLMQPEPDEDDMDKADMDTMKARQWDDFTEANPKGAGNTMNRG
jgi:immunoglobulin-binding protein 1